MRRSSECFSLPLLHLSLVHPTGKASDLGAPKGTDQKNKQTKNPKESQHSLTNEPGKGQPRKKVLRQQLLDCRQTSQETVTLSSPPTKAERKPELSPPPTEGYEAHPTVSLETTGRG